MEGKEWEEAGEDEQQKRQLPVLLCYWWPVGRFKSWLHLLVCSPETSIIVCRRVMADISAPPSCLTLSGTAFHLSGCRISCQSCFMTVLDVGVPGILIFRPKCPTTLPVWIKGTSTFVIRN